MSKIDGLPVLGRSRDGDPRSEIEAYVAERDELARLEGHVAGLRESVRRRERRLATLVTAARGILYVRLDEGRDGAGRPPRMLVIHRLGDLDMVQVLDMVEPDALAWPAPDPPPAAHAAVGPDDAAIAEAAFEAACADAVEPLPEVVFRAPFPGGGRCADGVPTWQVRDED